MIQGTRWFSMIAGETTKAKAAIIVMIGFMVFLLLDPRASSVNRPRKTRGGLGEWIKELLIFWRTKCQRKNTGARCVSVWRCHFVFCLFG